MKYYTTHFLFVFILLISLQSKAQRMFVYDLLPNELQSSLIINPASLMRTEGSEIGIFPLSSYHFDAYFPFSFNDVFNKNTLQTDFSKQLSNRKRPHHIFAQGSFEWFHFAGKYKESFWRISLQENTVTGARFENNFLKLINSGNAAFLGEELYLKFSVGWQHVRSLKFTWAKSLNDKIDAGINVKLYTGRSIFTAHTGLSVYTHPNVEYIQLEVEGKGKTSVPITLKQLTGSEQRNANLINYLFGFRNPGIGFDIGASYRHSPKFNFSASINDLGAIFWNRNTTSFVTDDIYRWKGIDISGPIDLDIFGNLKESETMVSFRDTFLNGLILPNDSPFLTFAPLSVNGGANYIMDTQLSFQAFTQLYLFRYNTKFNLGTTATFSAFNRLNVFAGLSLSNYSGISFPAGMTYNGRRLNATISAHHLVSILFPGTGRNYGGSFSLSYKIKPRPFVRNVTYQEYPFYRKKTIK